MTYGERRFRIYQPHFVDPFWFLAGSEPEKMVMAELARRGIYFEFRPQRNNLGGMVDPTWEGDIVVPQHKIWIEVQGAYYHTLPGQLKTDALRYAAIKMAGWKPLFWWEWDIRSRLVELVNEVPEFYRVDTAKEAKARKKYGTDFGLSFGVGSTKDQLVGHRTAMANRARPESFVFKRRERRERK